MQISLCIFVFSFNRGQFLENCIRSIEQCAPTLPITIIDDNSIDSGTISVLNRLATKYKVIRHTNTDTEKKTGGLYGNMNVAMEMANGIGYDAVIFIQDDMQLVRAFTDFDYTLVKKYFISNENSFQYVTNFQRILEGDKNAREFYVDESKTAYIKKKEFEGGKTNFSATGVFHVKRFFSLFGEFEVGESINSAKAQKKGLVKGKAVYPFMNWLPYPKSYRGRKRSLLHLITETIGGAGYHPIDFMDQSDVDSFLSRNPNQFPYMESYLKSPLNPRHDVWSTGGGEYNIIARGGFLASLFIKIKHMISFLWSL